MSLAAFAVCFSDWGEMKSQYSFNLHFLMIKDEHFYVFMDNLRLHNPEMTFLGITSDVQAAQFSFPVRVVSCSSLQQRCPEWAPTRTDRW